MSEEPSDEGKTQAFIGSGVFYGARIAKKNLEGQETLLEATGRTGEEALHIMLNLVALEKDVLVNKKKKEKNSLVG